MSDAVSKELLAEIRLMREEMSELHDELDIVHQKVDGLSVLLTMLAGASVEVEEDDMAAMMAELGDDNPQ
ncbi:hypothetical protein OCH239_02940 [Roseivivax halodurans JCM 10272]|uniref:Uncharacterized protein n=1 Tax=Roseivivax halodurans JCM 10272 TaxID=1449350 RepID=X7EH97_9RHOB|nr:hypothetical protein [Roseivivax halodurans]ETX14581.1 hypothetical protein OCH239_02940 [Roseivivax halodurans JCM 10272]